jgi:hypothetical protein
LWFIVSPRLESDGFSRYICALISDFAENP